MNKTNNKSSKDEQPIKPQILITFDSPDSINFVPEYDGVLPTQIMHAAKMLLMIGERRINDAWTKATMEQARKQAELAGIQSQISASNN